MKRDKVTQHDTVTQRDGVRAITRDSGANRPPGSSTEYAPLTNRRVAMIALPFHRTTKHRLLVCLLLLAGLLGASALSASAQQPAPPKTDTTIRTTLIPMTGSIDPKSPSRAQTYSVFGTLLPVLAGTKAPYLLGLGLVFGPATGHFYAKNYSQAFWGIGIRTGAPLLMGGLIGSGGELDDAIMAALIGGSIAAVSAIYDMATADNAARKYNERHASSVRVAPTVGPQGEQVGLSLQVSF